MKTRGNAVSWVAVLMAASSLFTMLCLFQIDKIVHNDLYSYGLRFSLQWATPYWTMARIAFTMGWLNIIAAIAVQLYTLAFRRKEVEELVTDVEEEIHKHETAPCEKAEERNNQELKPTQSPEQSEKSEERKEPEPAIEQKETKPQPPEKTEETPILAGVSEEEIPLITEKTPQQTAPCAS